MNEHTAELEALLRRALPFLEELEGSLGYVGRPSGGLSRVDNLCREIEAALGDDDE